MAEPMGKNMKYDVENMEDRISMLRDEILVSIISRLSLKEARATCILSWRWRYMCFFSTTLDFDADKCLNISENKLRIEEERRCVDWVDSVVNQHRAANLELFRIEFVFYDPRCINEWIRFAMRKGVQTLELDLSTKFDFELLRSKSPRYQFSNQVLRTREYLTFKDLCSEYIGFKFLRDVSFNRVDVDQETIEYFIFNCSVLERVAVCDSSLLVSLRVVGKSVALKHLMVQKCLNLESIEICEVNLESFTYGGDLEKLRLRNLPLLIEVSLICKVLAPGFTERWSRKMNFSYLSCCLSQLETLKINHKLGERDFVFPSLPNLKCLELTLDEDNRFALLEFSFLIRQIPRLHTLVVNFSSVGTSKRAFARKRAASCFHDCLKVVKFLRYFGHSRQIEFVKHLAKTAGNLGKIIFDPVIYCSMVDRWLYDDLPEREELSRAKAREIKEILPASLDVVCL